MFQLIISCIVLSLLPRPTFASSLVSKESVDRQRALTVVGSLKNGIPFVQRELPGNDIIHVEVSFNRGSADLPPEKKALAAVTLDVMTASTKGFSKEKIFALTEKHSIGLECSGGIEQSHCQVETISSNFDKAMDLLTAVIKDPLFEAEDIELTRQRRTAEFQQDAQNPEQHVNSLVNTLYYPEGHPYRLMPEDAIKQIAAFNRDDLVTFHKSLLNAAVMQIVYVGPKMSAVQKSRLDKEFSGLPKKDIPARAIPTPPYNKKANHIVFEHRDIPTAYIRAKFNAPGVRDSDAAIATVLFEILGERLHEEVRTKRSLSYAVGAVTVQYTNGIGIVMASTSKPQETIVTMADVLRDIKEKPISDEQLAEYKNVFATHYYLTLESHDQLASALSTNLTYFGDARKLYDLPAKLSLVTSADIQRVARDLLQKMNVAVIYDKDKFQTEWTAPLTAL